MDERQLWDWRNEYHQYVIDAEKREEAAEARHRELMRAIEQLTKTFDRGLRDLADALRAQGR